MTKIEQRLKGLFEFNRTLFLYEKDRDSLSDNRFVHRSKGTR